MTEQLNIKDFLSLVRKPSRYIGGEVNSVKKDLSKVSLKFGMGFPDAYEIGMSHLGLQILYQALNSREDIACERVFAPWDDMEKLLREKGAPLSTLESGIALKDLDIMGFSLQYELSYTNVLNMLDLGGIPLFSKDRREEEPFVIGGGPVAFNPEPVAEFFDAFLLGDGEEAVIEIADAVITGRKNRESRREILERLSRIQGMYVPSFFEVYYNDDGTVKEVKPLLNGYEKVSKRVVPDINSLPLPVKPVVPFMETIHDRVSVEISRGCTRGCRFCQAGSIYRPVRERAPENIIKLISEALKNTGYNEVSLLSLSTGDYTLIEDLLTGLMSRLEGEKVAISLPSLRVGTLSAKVATEIRKVKKTGFTLAPEAGSERLRQLINKGIKEEDLHAAARDVFSLGWTAMKLYFMIGLPTETDTDIQEIASLADCVKKIGREVSGKYPLVNASASTFIPKPYTPFQWEPQITIEECKRKQALLKNSLLSKRLGFKWHDPETSLMEGVFSRGDRRLSKALLKAFSMGARFDGWGDKFDYRLWQDAFRETGVDPAFYIYRRRERSEVFPWDHLNPGVTKEFLYRELENAINLARTYDCKVDRCTNCGVCDHKVIKNRSIGSDKALEELLKPTPRKAEKPSFRYRFKFAKTGVLKYLGHLELVSMIVRGIKRAKLPLKFSQGFHPHPKVSFTPPLPVGIESVEEYMDMELEERFPAARLMEELNKEMPEGLRFLECGEMPLKLSFPSAIMTEYVIDLKSGPAGLNIEPERLESLIKDFLAREAVEVRIEKEDKVTQVNVRPQIEDISLSGEYTLRLALRKGPGVRPHDILASLFDIPRTAASLIPTLKLKSIDQ